MLQIFRSISKLIPSSVKDAAQRVSSTRIQSYSLLALIWLCTLIFLTMEIVRASKSGEWEPSTTIEQIFMAILAHHVVMLGVSKNAKSEPRGDLFNQSNGMLLEEEETSSKPLQEIAKKSNTPKDPGKVNGKDIEDLI